MDVVWYVDTVNQSVPVNRERTLFSHEPSFLAYGWTKNKKAIVFS